MLLVPQVIPATALGNGMLDMRLFLSNALADRYAGAFTLRFDEIGSSGVSADFMYSLDSQGLRIEYAPQTSLDGITVVRRASTPLVIYFFKSETPAERPLIDFSAPGTAPPSRYEESRPGYSVPGVQEFFQEYGFTDNYDETYYDDFPGPDDTDPAADFEPGYLPEYDD